MYIDMIEEPALWFDVGIKRYTTVAYLVHLAFRCGLM